MQNYSIEQAITLKSGVIELSAAQFARRKHMQALKLISKGKYEIIKPVSFKAGEVIGFEGDLPKALASVMVDEAEAEVKKTKSKKAEVKAAEKSEAEAKAGQEEKFQVLGAEIKALPAAELDDILTT